MPHPYPACKTIFLAFLAVAFTSTASCTSDHSTATISPERAAQELPDYHQDVPLPRTVAPVMKAKVAHAQAVLEGIALEDFDQIHDNARSLMALSRSADWLVHRTIAYEIYSEEFKRITQRLQIHAEKHNLHAVTLAYMELTMTCVKCHTHMRQEGLALLPVQ